MMKPPVWRVVSLAYGALLLWLAVWSSYAALFDNTDHGFTAKPKTPDLSRLTVSAIANRAAIAGPLDVGDTVSLADQSFTNRVRFAAERPGDRFSFVRTTPGGRTSTFVVTMLRAAPAGPAFWSFIAMGAVYVLVAMVIAARRPEDVLARLLVGLFFSLGTIVLTGPQPLMPLWMLVAVLALHLFTQAFTAFAALALAVSFPAPSMRGIRWWLARANVWLLLACVAILFTEFVRILALQLAPAGWLVFAGIALTLAYYVGISIAFVVAGRGAAGADRKRLQWVAWTLAAGFSGELVLLLFIAFRIPIPDWLVWGNLTLLAIPFGLGYAIVRHRVVDIGFVINRAIVFGSISVIVVVAFMVLEWALANVFVKISHITSTALELGLALVLGFSLRTIHAKVDRFVDDLFFRDRHAAERALRTFARDVGYITDPRTTLARAHAELSARTGAGAVTIYLLDARSALRVDPAESEAPDRVDVDDGALVRMRATRAPLALATVTTALAGDHAFPMMVRDALTGALVLGPKTNGEAYAPDELATIEAVAIALGNALDALQTAALKAEVASVLIDGTPLEGLRRTADSAAWLRAVASS